MSENAKSGVFFSQSDFRGIYMCHSQKKHQKTVNLRQKNSEPALYILYRGLEQKTEIEILL